MNLDKVKSMTPFNRLVYWIKERECIRCIRLSRDDPPWTQDPILQQYRFCNVRREDDKVTKWIAKNWREPHKDEPDLWFAMVVARLFNLPSTLEAIGFPVPWTDNTKLLVVSKLEELRQRGPIFNGAYIVSTNGKKMDKVEYLFKLVLGPLWKDRERIRPRGHTVEHCDNYLFKFHERLMSYDGLGSFMAAQVVADMKYVPPLTKAHDWHTFAASGPGSRRGLNRVLGRHPNEPWKETVWREELAKLREKVNAVLAKQLHITLHASDVQSCLCEFDKYERCLWGEGRPKQKYQGM